MTTKEMPTPPYAATYGELQEGDVYIPRTDGVWESAAKYNSDVIEHGPSTPVVVLSRSIWPTERMIRVIEGVENAESISGEIFHHDRGQAYGAVTNVDREIMRDFRGDVIERYEEVIPISLSLLERVIQEGESCQYCDDCPTMGTHTVMAELRKAIEKWWKEGK